MRKGNEYYRKCVDRYEKLVAEWKNFLAAIDMQGDTTRIEFDDFGKRIFLQFFVELREVDLGIGRVTYGLVENADNPYQRRDTPITSIRFNLTATVFFTVAGNDHAVAMHEPATVKDQHCMVVLRMLGYLFEGEILH